MKELIKKATEYLVNYDGPQINLMEICGTHTNALSKTGIRGMISPKINLISGPGCPVCVTATGYIDKLIELANEGKVICCYGDLLRVPGSVKSLNDIKAEGADVRMIYSSADVIDMAVLEADKEFIIAAVGFETTLPAYCLDIETIIEKDINNVKLLTSLKTMPEVTKYLCQNNKKIDGFLAPGHVCAVTGYEIFEQIAKEFNLPFIVGGFEAGELIIALYALMLNLKKGVVVNCYQAATDRCADNNWSMLKNKYFTEAHVFWRGFGLISNSGLVLKDEYACYDAGSRDINVDNPPKGCSCGKVLLGEIKPCECPLFMKACRPESPVGACMVSEEGSCHAYAYL